MVNLTYRTQGLYVAKGNPLDLHAWEDLGEQGVRLINREKGAGSRVLLTSHFAHTASTPTRSKAMAMRCSLI